MPSVPGVTRRVGGRRLLAAIGLLGTVPLLALASPSDYLCRTVDGTEHTVAREAARAHRQAGLACLPIITRETPPTSFTLPGDATPEEGDGDGDGDGDIVTLHIGITVISAPVARSTVNASPPAGGLPTPPAAIVASLRLASQRQRLDPALLAAVMYVESRYRPEARSPKGALGLMQVMLSTARQYGVHSEQALLNPHVNIEVGARHLRSLIDRFGNRLDLVLAAYNAGEGAVLRHGHRIPPYAETRQYVDKVLSLMQGGATL